MIKTDFIFDTNKQYNFCSKYANFFGLLFNSHQKCFNYNYANKSSSNNELNIVSTLYACIYL